MLTYTNSLYRLSIQYPEDWSAEEDFLGTLVMFLSPRKVAANNFHENLNISVVDLAETPLTLDQLTEVNIIQLSKVINELEVVSLYNVTLAKQEATKLVVTGKHDQIEVKWLLVYTIKNNNAYIITYTATVKEYAVYLKTVRKMIGSFKVI